MSTYRKFWQILSVTVILAILFSAVSAPVASAQSGDGLKRERNAQTGKVSFIGPQSGRVLPAARALGTSPSARPADPALALLKRFGPEFGLKNPARDLQEKATKRSNNGRLAVHYQQAYQGIPVIGGELIVNTNENGDLYSINGEVSSNISLATEPAVGAEQARQTALEAAAQWYQKTPEDFVASGPELWIYDESLLQPSTRPVELVWRLEVTPREVDAPIRELILIHAQRGSISLHFNQVDTAWSFDEQRESAPQSTSTALPTEVPTETPEAANPATPTPAPLQASEEASRPDAKNERESLEDGTWYVSNAGNDSNSCLEPVSPCATIQAAINKASGGNTIRVAEGTYYYTSINANPNVVIINKSITLSGGWQTDFSSQTGASIIDGQNTNNGILANAAGSTVVIDHLVVRNSRTGSDSGGIYLYAANFTLQNSSIINNTGGRGAGIFMIGNANLSVLNSTISGNRAGSSGGGIHAVNGTITINNSTIAYNHSNVTGGGIRPESGTVLVRNSILAKNTATTSGPNCAGSISSSDHNIIETITGCTVTSGTGDQFNVDPLIDSGLTGVLPLYTLQTTSPAVNAGDNSTCLSTDQRGVTRPQGSVCDIGAYELVQSKSISVLGGSDQNAQVSTAFGSPLSVLVIDDSGNPAIGLTVTFVAADSGASGTFADTGTNVTTALTNDSGVAASSIFTANDQPGQYNVHATVTGYDSPAIFDLRNTNAPVADFYVSPSGSDSNSCSLPTAPCLTLNAAISKAAADDAIAVAAGTYAPASIAKSLTLLGGWDSSFAAQTGHSIVQSNSTAVDAISSTGTLVSISRFVLQNSRYGIYHNGGTLNFERGALINNKNGIYNYSGDTTFTNATLSGNRDSSLSGSAISNVNGTVRIQHSTISNNGGSEAIYSLNSNSRIEIGDSLLAGNPIGDCRIGSTNMTSFGHNIFGRSPACSGSTGFVPDPTDQVGGDPQLLPLFVLGYHPVSPTSLAVDHANPATCPATDQRGVERPQGGGCDIGAYEYMVPGSAASFGIASGSNQHSGPSLPFRLPLTVYVMDAFGSPVSGATVTFTAPASGPSGTFGDTGTNVTTAITDNNGIATSAIFTANSQAGSYTVTASVEGVASSVSFALTNAVWFVSPTGSDSRSCTSPATACLTISAAHGKAANGDAIMVAAGTYVSWIGISKSLTLSGGWDTAFTSQTGYSTITAGATSDGMTVTGANVSMSGFIIQNSKYGLYHNGGTLSFERGALINNKGGLYNFGGETTFTNTTISGNDGSGVTASAITNDSGTVRIRYSTITNNAGSYAIYSTTSSTHVEIGNSILAGNPGADCYVGNNSLTSTGHNIFGRSPICSSSYNVVPDPTDQVGTAPQLSALLPLGYHAVAESSPAVDQADPAACPASDQRGVARPQGTACDIGAYEYKPIGPAVSFGIASGSNQRSGLSLPFQVPLAVAVMDAFGGPVSGVSVTFTAPASGPSGTFTDTQTNTTVATTNDSGIATSSGFIANSQMGTYSVVAAVAGISGSLNFSLTNASWYVAPTGSDSNSCTVSTSPCLTINAAITKAVEGDTILVAAGTYAPITISKSLTLFGGWDSAFTSQTGYSILQGSTTVDAISTSGTNVSISRFVAQSSRYGIYHNGGTLSFEQGALINNKVGIYNYSGNTALTNTTISGNQSSGASGIGNINGTIRIRYSTITNNSGSEAIVSLNGGANIIIGDSILAGNPVRDCYVGSTNMISTGHNIFGRSPACYGSTGFVPDPTDQVGVNPQLLPLVLPGYHPLSPTSPAVDHADPATCPAADQRGVARPQGAACDIGAFEYTTAGPAASFGIASGSNQRASAPQPFLLPFVVYVVDADGNPVDGATVTFTAPSSGPSGTFADTGTPATSVVSSAGIATSPVFTANSQIGTYNVTATVAGVEGSVSFALTNVAWYVAPTGSDSNSCNAPASPCLTLSGAMAKAADREMIMVAVGTYPPITISKSLTLSGGWDTTFTSRTGYSTIQGDGDSDTYGISTGSPLVSVSGFIVQNNHHGIHHSGGNLSFERGALIDNNNGAYNLSGDITFTNTTISGNHVLGTVGSAISNVTGTIRIRYTTITNNTNSEAIYSRNGGANIIIGDSILAGNPDGDCNAGSSNMTSTGHNIFGRSPICSSSYGVVPHATDRVGVNPQLLPLFLLGYHPLSSTSPAVDHADPATCPAADQRGVARPQGAACDIGAFEYTTAGPAASFGIISGSNQRTGPSLPFILPLAVYVVDADGNPVDGATVTFTAPSSGPSGTFADTGTPATSVVSSAGIATSPVFRANSQIGTYNVTATVTGVSNSLSFTLTNVAWYVAPTGSDSNSCNAPASPCLTLSGAMAKAATGDAIMVAAGTYPPITIAKSLSLWGGWDNAFTSRTGYSTINGDLNSNGITVSGGDVFISRFVTQNSYFGIHHSGRGMLRFDQGASINNSNGLYNLAGDMIFTNTTLSGNYVRARQGIHYAGSAISNVDGLIRIQYSTITNNGGSEAIHSANGSAQIEIGNSILAGNPGGDCPEYGVNITSVGRNIFGSSPACGDDFVPHATDQTGVNPKLLPLFAKGYHPLLSGSPAIDAADPFNCPASDQRGIARPVGTACDIGAVEYTAAGTTPRYILVYQGSPQIILLNSPAASRLVAVVYDENGNTVQGQAVTFTAPEQGASVIFADTGTNIATVVTGGNGLATSPAFAANDLAGSYVVVARINGVNTPASFSLNNSTIALAAEIKTYTANNNNTLPGTFLCDQTTPGCTDGQDLHADAAHRYAIGTYAFYAGQHSRYSIDNAGMPIISSVHVSSGYANAGWTGSQMVYGDAYGFALADDVVGHELTHGVTQYESNLFYYYQSGAINESFSDLWGEYYDQTNGLGNDDTAVQWLMGEDVSGLGAIRSLSNPPAYSDPDRMTSTYYYTGAVDNGGVHTNSGVNNKAVFLMVEGGSFNGKTVTALGWEKTAAIYYEANTNLLSSGADYSDLYYALQQACTNLIGQKGITSADCLTLKEALEAVEMNAQPVPNFNPDAPDCDAQERAAIVFSDGLESGTRNWTFSNGSALRWQLDSAYGPNAHSGSHSLYADDYPPTVTDATAQLTSIVIPEDAYLHFAHAYDFQSSGSYYYDGGVLEYSVDEGVTWNDTGSLMDFNGYDGPIRTGSGNPLQGRSAFGGSSHGYISTRLNLANLAGQTVSFRWRMGLDQSAYAWGWWLDDVRIYQCLPIDTTPPTVVSIVRAAPDPTSAASVDFSVTFSEPVTGVDISDFALDTTGNIVGASIAAVNGSGSTWTVSVATGSGDGTLGLRVPVDADIQDTVGNSLGGLPFTGTEPYTVDKTMPVLSSILRMGANPAHTDSVAFQVNFSKPVTGVDAADFSFYIGTGSISDAVIESVAADASCTAYCQIYVVTVNTGSGSGVLGLLPILPNATIVDAAGNLLDEAPVYTEVYLIDKIAPLVSSIVRAGANPAAAESVDFTVTFSEEVAGVNTVAPFGDFVLSTTGITDAAITEIRGSGATWTVTVNTGSGDGTLDLDLAVEASITDLAGNLLEQEPFAPDEEYTIDKTHAFLVAPANGEELLYRRPSFDWSDVPGAGSYRIAASRGSSFNTILWEVETTDSTYTPGADLPGGRVIYWRVRAQVNDTLGPWSETWSFTTGNPPSIPTLSSPANASLTTDYTPLLNWSDASVPTGAAAFDHYEVQVATDTLFSDPVLIDENTAAGQVTASSYTPVTDLAANTTYFWRARSFNVSGQYSSWSTVRSFRTALLPPGNLAPAGGVTVSSRQPVLDWDAVDGAEGYTVQISTNSSFSSLLVNTSTAANTFTPDTNLPANRTIYWRVRTTGANGPSRWTTASFKTP